MDIILKKFERLEEKYVKSQQSPTKIEFKKDKKIDNYTNITMMLKIEVIL